MNDFEGVQDESWTRQLIDQLIRRPWGIENAGYLPRLLDADPRGRSMAYGWLLGCEQKSPGKSPDVEWPLFVGRFVFGLATSPGREFEFEREILEPFLSFINRLGLDNHVGQGQRHRDMIAHLEKIDPTLCKSREASLYRVLHDCKETPAWKLTVVDRVMPSVDSYKRKEWQVYRKTLMVKSATTGNEQKAAYDSILAETFANKETEASDVVHRWFVFARSTRAMQIEILRGKTAAEAAGVLLSKFPGATDIAVMPISRFHEIHLAAQGNYPQCPVMVWERGVGKPKIYGDGEYAIERGQLKGGRR